MLKQLVMLTASIALAAGPAFAGEVMEYGVTFKQLPYMGNKMETSHATWETEFGKPELRLSSDITEQREPLVAAAVVSDADVSGISGPPVEVLEFTYRKNIEKETDPVLRVLLSSGEVKTYKVFELKREAQPGNFTRVTCDISKLNTHVNAFAVCGQAHRKNHDGCNFQVINPRWRVNGKWYEPQKDLHVRQLEVGGAGKLEQLLARFY